VWPTGGWPVLDGRRVVWPSIARVRGRRSRWRAGSVGEGVALSGPPQAGEVRHEIAWGVFIGELQIGVSLGVRRSDTLVHAGEGAAGTAPANSSKTIKILARPAPLAAKASKTRRRTKTGNPRHRQSWLEYFVRDCPGFGRGFFHHDGSESGWDGRTSRRIPTSRCLHKEFLLSLVGTVYHRRLSQ